jgi:hypothetical protein
MGPTQEDIETANLLMEMQAIYPGDTHGSIAKDICRLLQVPYEPIEITVTYD